MIIRTLATAAGLAMMLATASPVLAQSPEPARAASDPDLDELRALMPELIDKLNALAAGMGIESLPPIDWDRFLGDFQAALPTLPPEDDREWGSAVDFEFRTTDISQDGQPGTLSPEDEDARPIIGDAAGCISDQPNARVVHFRRIRDGDIRGHQCVFTVETDTNVWVLYSRTYAEGHGRRLNAKYGVAVSADGDIATAREIGEPKIEAQVAVASSIANYALGLMDRAPAATPQGE
jgi:hypothetical protein